MPKSVILTASLWLLVSSVVYIVTLGDSGYIRHRQLEAELKELEATIEDLKRENAVLNENYYLEQEKEKEQKKGTTIVLKFEQEELRKTRPVKIRGLGEYRILYWFVAVFTGLILATILLSDGQERIDLILRRRILNIFHGSKNHE